MLGVLLGVTLGALARAALISACVLAACAVPGAALPGPSPPAVAARPAPTAWPELPLTPEGAHRVLAAHTRRPPRTEPTLTRESLEASLLSAARKNQLVSGYDTIAAFLRARATRPSFVLFGTYHDAPGQVVAFRRLAGVLGFGATDAVIEQFHARGRWSNVPAPEQAGDAAALDVVPRLDGVIASQRAHNHTAWKYDYLEELPALVATLRAGGVRLHGCDLPTALQTRLRPVGDAALAGLRELHCVLALGEGAHGPATVAMLWGARHVAADGVQRFLPSGATVVSIEVFGGRPSGDGIEARLGFRFTDPVLFPVEGRDRFALVLPLGTLAARVDRARTSLRVGDPVGKLVVTSDPEVELWVDGHAERVGARPRELPILPGPHAFVAGSVAGAVFVPEGGYSELHLGGDTQVIEHAPTP